MLKRHNNTIFCPDCGRSWDCFSGLSAGAKCPSDDCPSNENSPLGIVHQVVVQSEGLGIHAVGANAALMAMLRHWKDHLEDGHDPQIIDSDTRDMINLLVEMRTEIRQKIDKGGSKVSLAATSSLPFSLYQGQTDLGAFATLVDTVQAGNLRSAEAFVSEQPQTESEIMISFNDTSLTLEEARQQLSCETLTNAADFLESIAIHGDFNKEYLVEIAKSCRVVLRTDV